MKLNTMLILPRLIHRKNNNNDSTMRIFMFFISTTRRNRSRIEMLTKKNSVRFDDKNVTKPNECCVPAGENASKKEKC